MIREKTRKYLVLCLLGVLCALQVRATEVNTVEILEDSTALVLGASYRSKLDSAAVYESQGNHKAAIDLYESGLEALKKYNQYRREQIATYLETIYQTEQKGEQLAFLNETVELKRIQNLLLIVFCLVLAATLIFLFFMLSYRLRSILQRAEQERNEADLTRLEQERKEMEIRLQEMESEKIQKELLAESLLVGYKNRLIGDLSNFLVETPELNNYKVELEGILFPSSHAEEFEMETEVGTRIREVHPRFYTRLQEQANHKLTDLDMEYCRMIFLNMSSKEMAEVLKVDPKTVRMGKYRLKMKLGLGKEEDLKEVIEKNA